MSFDGRDLRAFLAIVDCGSLGRAAARVHLSQPALSRRVQELERRLGSPLFERHSKGMALTPAGEALLAPARLLLFEMEQAEQAVAELNGMRRGTLRLGAVAALCRDLVPRALATLAAEAPDLAVDLLEAPDSELAEALRERRVDLVVASQLLDSDEIEAVAPLPLRDRFAPCSRSGHAIAVPGAPLAALLGCRWVMLHPGRGPREQFEALVAATGHALPTIAVETNTLGAQIALVAATDLLAWLPLGLVADRVRAGTLIAHAEPALTLERGFRLYRRRRAILAKPAELALRHLEAAARAIEGEATPSAPPAR